MSSAVAQCLQDTLNPDINVRTAAEKNLADATKSPDAALELATVAVGNSFEPYIRQAAGLALRKYVKDHWGPYFSTFKGDGPSVEQKEHLRNLIYSGISCPDRKVRLACAVVICDIAHSDWPDEYPNLLTSLVNSIASEDPNAVHGAMRVLTDFINNDLSESQFLPIARDLMPALLKVLVSSDKYSPITRSRTIIVLRQCVEILFMVKESHKNIVNESVSQLLPGWIEAFEAILSQDVNQEIVSGQVGWEMLSVRIEIYRVLDIILSSFHRHILNHFPKLLAYSLQQLSSLEQLFNSFYLLDTQSPPSVDEPDVNISITLLVSVIFEFFASARQRSSFRPFFTEDVLEKCFKAAFFYTQMTAEDEDTWESDPNAFIQDEDEEEPSYTLRVAAQDLTSGLVEEFGKNALSYLNAALWKRFEDAERRKSNGDEKWWKDYEAGLSLLECISEDLLLVIEDAKDSGLPLPVDLENVFQNAVFPYLQSSPMFLQGRAFVFSSKFSALLPSNMSEELLTAMVNVLTSQTVSIPIKISSLRAARHYCRVLPKELTRPHIKSILASLEPLLAQDSTSVLILAVETAEAAMKTEAPLDIQTTTSVATMVLNTWYRQPQDPVLGPTICEFFEAFAAIEMPEISTTLSQTVAPRLVLGLEEVKDQETVSEEDDGLLPPHVGSAVSILNSIMSGVSPDSVSSLVNIICSPFFALLSTCLDREVTQEGLLILTSIVRKDSSSLMTWVDENGKNGIQLSLEVLIKLLGPDREESGGLFVGELTLHLIRRAGDIILPVAPDLLRVFVQRLGTAVTSTFTQSLILPFAYLLHTHFDVVLDLLESIQQEGESGLHVLLSKWCEHHPSFQGYWNIRISTTALAKLLTSNKPILNSIYVKGDLIPNQFPPGVIVTRSMARNHPEEYTSVPAKVKIIKILLNDISNSNVDDEKGGDRAVGEGSDEDDDWVDEEEDFSMRHKNVMMLSDMLDMDFGDDFNDDLDDPDLKEDPVYQIEPNEQIVRTLKHTYADHASDMEQFAEFLTAEEKESLRKIIMNS